MDVRHYRMYPPDAYLGWTEEDVAIDWPHAAIVLTDVYGTGYADDEIRSPVPGYMGKLDFEAKRSVVREALVPIVDAARSSRIATVFATNSAPRAALEQTSYAAIQRRLGCAITGDYAENCNDPHEYTSGASEVLRFSRLLEPRPGDYYIRKWVYSGFYNTRLDRLLRNLRVQDVFLAGFTAETGMLCTALDALHLGYRVFWIRDATLAIGDSSGDRSMTERITLWAENYVGYSLTARGFADACQRPRAQTSG